MAGTTPNRWHVRSLVVLTALLCLGVAGYAGQVWWARCAATRFIELVETRRKAQLEGAGYWSRVNWICEVKFEWKPDRWCGKYSDHLYFYMLDGGNVNLGLDQSCWMPRRTYHELLILITGLDLPNDPAVWEAWFKAHPDLVWDDSLKRLVDKP